jgi:hypothetical protein
MLTKTQTIRILYRAFGEQHIQLRPVLPKVLVLFMRGGKNAHLLQNRHRLQTFRYTSLS